MRRQTDRERERDVRRERDAKPRARLTDRLIWSLSRNGVLMKHDQKRLHRQRQQQLFIWSSAHKIFHVFGSFPIATECARFPFHAVRACHVFQLNNGRFFFVALPCYQNRNILIKTEHKMIHDNNKISHHQNPNNIVKQTILIYMVWVCLRCRGDR